MPGKDSMQDAIDELVARSKPHPPLAKFHDYHRAHPELLDFLVREAYLRIEHGFKAFSYNSLCEYARWKLELERGPGETFVLNDHLARFYGRAIVILHPDLNGRCEFRRSLADELFGTELEAVKRRDGYASRLRWRDGTTLADGWKPARPHRPSREAKRKQDIHARVA